MRGKQLRLVPAFNAQIAINGANPRSPPTHHAVRLDVPAEFDGPDAEIASVASWFIDSLVLILFTMTA